VNPKQKAFVREYAIDHNATQAAKRAGYSEKTAYSIGQENLKKPEIAAAVAKTEAKHAERCNVTVDSITEDLDADRQLAHKVGQAGAAVSASMGKAKLHGLVVDKREDVTKRTREENIERTTELLERFGNKAKSRHAGNDAGGGSGAKPN
jgi:phage terminase small subunit